MKGKKENLKTFAVQQPCSQGWCSHRGPQCPGKSWNKYNLISVDKTNYLKKLKSNKISLQ